MVWCNMGVPLDNVKSTKPFFNFFLSFPCVPSGVDKAQYEAVPGRVSFPKIMYMTEVEKQDALHKLRTTDDLEAKDPFLFIFTQQEDMEVFLQGCVDQQHLHVNAMFDGEL